MVIPFVVVAAGELQHITAGIATHFKAAQ